MHLEDIESNSINGQQIIGLNIINTNGEKYEMQVTNDLNVDKLKTMCLSYFESDPLVTIKMGQQLKLVSVEHNRPLSEESNLTEEGISSGMVLLLLPRIPYKKHSEQSLAQEMKSRSPNDDDINTATEGLVDKNTDRKPIEISNTIDFQKELRKILISLIDYSETVLKSHPEVKPIFDAMDSESNSDKKSNEQSDEEIDGISNEILKQLTDMGFPVDRAKRALKLNNMSAIDAMDWLLANSITTESSPSPSSSRTIDETAEESAQSHYSSETSFYPRVPKIIGCYRAFKRKQYKPNSKAVKSLCDMGFDENEVLDALSIHTYNEIAACEWLLSDRRPKQSDLENGLSKNSPIYKAIISNPVIQLGLVKPRVFFAFMELIEEPNSTGRWLSDSQTSPILSQMFRIFHSEKHAIQQ